MSDKNGEYYFWPNLISSAGLLLATCESSMLKGQLKSWKRSFIQHSLTDGYGRAADMELL